MTCERYNREEHRRPTVGKPKTTYDSVCCQVCCNPSATIINFPGSNVITQVTLCNTCTKVLKGLL